MDIVERLKQHAARDTLAREGATTTGLTKLAAHNTKAIDREARTIDFVVSTSSVDRDGDIIDVRGWKLDDYRKNPVVLWGHNSREPAVAKASEIGVIGDQLVARAQFPTREESPKSHELFNLYAGGYMKAVSAGFTILSASDILDDETGRFRGLHSHEHDLWEFSLVTIPSNRDALVRAKGAGLELASWAEWAEEIRDDFLMDDRDRPFGELLADNLDAIAKRAIIVEAPSGGFVKIGNLPSDIAPDLTSRLTDAAKDIADGLLTPRQSEEVTNFPEHGDREFVSLANSNFRKYPVALQTALAKNWPTIWKHGTVEPFTDDDASIRRRERDAADVITRTGLSGVVDCVRLLLVHERGLGYMDAVLSQEKQKIADTSEREKPVIILRNPKNRRITIGKKTIERAENE